VRLYLWKIIGISKPLWDWFIRDLAGDRIPVNQKTSQLPVIPRHLLSSSSGIDLQTLSSPLLSLIFGASVRLEPQPCERIILVKALWLGLDA
jgi:hypothetical protein